MLTGYQIEVVGFVTDGDVICPDCAVKRTSTVTVEKLERGLPASVDWEPLIRYTAEEEWSAEGLYCGDCTNEIVEPYQLEANDVAWEIMNLVAHWPDSGITRTVQGHITPDFQIEHQGRKYTITIEAEEEE